MMPKASKGSVNKKVVDALASAWTADWALASVMSYRPAIGYQAVARSSSAVRRSTPTSWETPRSIMVTP